MNRNNWDLFNNGSTIDVDGVVTILSTVNIHSKKSISGLQISMRLPNLFFNISQL